MKFRPVLFVFILLFLVSCNFKKSGRSPVVARVGKSTLTLEELKQDIPMNASLELSAVQIQRYVQRWVESELVYQQALKEGFGKRREVKEHIKSLAKDYIVSTFVDQYTNQKLKVTDNEIKSYYDKNSDEFNRPQDQYNIRLILVESYRKGRAVRNELMGGTDFAELARKHSIDESKDDGGELGWITLDRLPSDLAARIPRLTLDSPSSPIRTSVGYYIVEPLGVRKKGQLQTLDEVRDVIMMRLQIIKKEQNYRRLVNRLSENTEFSTNWNVLKQLNIDSTQTN